MAPPAGLPPRTAARKASPKGDRLAHRGRRVRVPPRGTADPLGYGLGMEELVSAELGCMTGAGALSRWGQKEQLCSVAATAMRIPCAVLSGTSEDPLPSVPTGVGGMCLTHQGGWHHLRANPCAKGSVKSRVNMTEITDGGELLQKIMRMSDFFSTTEQFKKQKQPPPLPATPQQSQH